MIKKNGFTLVELLVTISIIVILTAVAAISFSKAQVSGRNSRKKEDIKMIQNAAEQYFLLNNSYPSATNVAWTGPGAQPILQKFPVDPKTDINGVNVSYKYTYDAVTGGYCACAELENSNTGNSTNNACDFAGATDSDADYFCVKNQQ